MLDEVVGNVVFGAEILCGVIAWLSWARAMVIWWKLGRYLEKQNPDRLMWLVGAREMGQLCYRNPFRLISYFFSDEDGDDPIILRSKCRIRQSMKLTLVMVVTMIALILPFGIFMILWTGGNH